MKKFLIGCGIVAFIFIVLAVGSTVYCVSKVKQMATRWEAAGKAIGDTNAANPFTEPADLTLTQAQLDRYFEVRSNFWGRLMADKVISKMVGDINNKTNTMGVGDIVSLIFDSYKYLEFLADELNKSGMSAKEMQWTGRTLYLTIERGRKDKDPEYLELVDSIKANLDEINKVMNQSGQQNNQMRWEPTIAMMKDDADDIPEANLELVRQYFERLKADPAYYLELMMVIMDLQQPQAPANATFTIGDTTGSTAAQPATAE